jgi:hypothetical protein
VQTLFIYSLFLQMLPKKKQKKGKKVLLLPAGVTRFAAQTVNSKWP